MDFVNLLDDIFGCRCWLENGLFFLELLNKLFFDFFDSSLEVVSRYFLLGQAEEAFLSRVETDIEHVSEVGLPIKC